VGGVWERISRLVVRRPLTVFFASLALLVPFALLGLRVSPTFKPTGDLSPRSGSVRGLEAIQRRFPAGETGPITVLLVSRDDWKAPAGREAIKSLCRGLQFLDNVAEVRSVTQPLGKPLPEFREDTSTSKNAVADVLKNLKREIGGFLGKSLEKANAVYLSRIDSENGIEHVARVDVVLNSDPFEPPSVATLGALEAYLRTQLPPDIRSECYGVTVHTRDMEKLIESDRTRVNLLVMGGVLLILLMVVKKPWLALYLLGTVLLSYYATLGATALFATWYGGREFGQIEWRVPFFLFTILVAIGEDYNILMVSRALQERKRFGAVEGLRRGLARTGGTITACGVIMAGTFATLMLADLWTLVQIGFALAVGVLVDTLLVRPLLVPSMMLVVWRDYEEPEAPDVLPLWREAPRVKKPLAA